MVLKRDSDSKRTTDPKSKYRLTTDVLIPTTAITGYATALRWCSHGSKFVTARIS